MKTCLGISDKNASNKKYNDIEISLLPVQNWTQQMTLKDDFFNTLFMQQSVYSCLFIVCAL